MRNQYYILLIVSLVQASGIGAYRKLQNQYTTQVNKSLKDQLLNFFTVATYYHLPLSIEEGKGIYWDQ